VDVHVLHAAELDRALAIVTDVAGTLRADPAWADVIASDSRTNIWVTGIVVDGASIRMQQQTPTGAQIVVASELRRRLSAALAAQSIDTARWDVPIVGQLSGSPLAG